MNLDISILGTSQDVNLFIDHIKKAYPNINLGDIDFYPHNHFKPDSNLIGAVFTLTGGDNK